jgi:hypothetical protein
MVSHYYPEMNEAKPVATIEARLGYDGHYHLKTPLHLSGRGVTYTGQLTSERLIPQAQHKAGWNEYRVTKAAYAKICEAYSVSVECLL